MDRFTIAAASLLFATAATAQTSALGNAPSGSSQTKNGVFRPAESVPEPSKAVTAPAASQPATPIEPTPVLSMGKEYKVGTNDLLDIEVLNLDSGKRTVRVNAAGYITLPLLGPVAVAGLTQQQVETRIASLYGEKYLQDPQVSVFIREFTTERITLDGAVARPGIYPLVGQMTLLRALALAGGFGQIASTSNVKVFRRAENGEREVATFDIEKIRAGKDEDPLVRGDDMIIVQRNPTRALLKDSAFRDVLDYINPFSVLTR